MGIEGTYLNIIKAIDDKPRANVILKSEKLKEFLLRSGTRQECLLLLLLFNIDLEVLATAIRRKRNKRNPNWKGSKTITIFRWHDTKRVLKTITKVLELINDFGKVTGYKINSQKLTAFLCTKNKSSEREIIETIPFTITSKRIKYLGINVPKEKKICILKTIRRWWKKSKMTPTDGKTYLVLGLEESILSKWLYDPRQSIDSMKSLSNYQGYFLQTLNKIF